MDDNVESFVAAILYLADSDLRMHLARRLTMLMPEYVAAQRPLDAWLIQFSAFQMIEAPEQSNPFLFEMFLFGYEEWVQQMEDQEAALMRELGVEPDELREGELGLADAEGWLLDKLTAPDAQTRLDAYLAEHPMMREHAQAEVLALERKSLLLLDREDAGPLYLSMDEVEPWIGPLVDRLGPLARRSAQVAWEADSGVPPFSEEIGKTMVEISRKMAASVFSPERVRALQGTLEAYQQQLRDAGDHQAALYAHGGLVALEHEPHPPDNPLLVGICLASLRAVMIEAAEKPDEDT
jgi:hypothetical protein